MQVSVARTRCGQWGSALGANCSSPFALTWAPGHGADDVAAPDAALTSAGMEPHPVAKLSVLLVCKSGRLSTSPAAVQGSTANGSPCRRHLHQLCYSTSTVAQTGQMLL